jgi:hypothetical protein
MASPPEVAAGAERVGTRSTHTGPIPSADEACRPCAARIGTRSTHTGTLPSADGVLGVLTSGHFLPPRLLPSTVPESPLSVICRRERSSILRRDVDSRRHCPRRGGRRLCAGGRCHDQ